MNLSTIPTTLPPPFLMAAEPSPSADAGSSGAVHDHHSHHMDLAMGLEEASLAAVQLQSCVIHMCENASWSSAALCDLLEMAAQAVKTCLDLQLSWLALMAPFAITRVEASSPIAVPDRTPAGSFRNQARHAADGFEYSMDIAIGAQAVEGFERGMDLSIRMAA